MKGTWEAPRIMVQEFEANEYVAACGDENKVYKFTCDAPAGDVYADGYGHLGGYHPCSKTHEASVKSDFVHGYVDRNRNGKEDEGETAIIWVEKETFWGQSYVKDWHATTNLNINSWETAKS